MNVSSNTRKQGQRRKADSVQFRGAAITPMSKTRLLVAFPLDMPDLKEVEVNGVLYYREGMERVEIRTAPVKYPDDHLREVNWLVEHKHFKKEAALGDIADKYGYDFDNFRRAYYDRKGSSMGSKEAE